MFTRQDTSLYGWFETVLIKVRIDEQGNCISLVVYYMCWSDGSGSERSRLGKNILPARTQPL